MNITRHNCEAVFLDYYEKELSPVEVAELLFFLEENADLKAVFEGYEDIFLEQEKIKFPHKGSLKNRFSREEIESILSSEINKTNCEQFFVASTEGLLSETQNRELHSFLAKHPELKKDFELFQKCKLTAGHLSFDNKDLLKKETINIRNREEYFVRAIEKDLNSQEYKQFESFLQKNPEYAKEFILFEKTILKPESIRFEFKSRLKKKERKPIFVSIFLQRGAYYTAAVAAVLLIVLFFFFESNDYKAVYFANKTSGTNSKVRNIKLTKENSILIEKRRVLSSRGIEEGYNENKRGKRRNAISVNKNLKTKQSEAKEEKNILLPILSNDITDITTEEPLIANRIEENEAEQKKIESNETAQNTEAKTDSIAVLSVQNNAVIVLTAGMSKKSDGYQTVRSFLNKKARSILGIEKSTECETADNINLWDLAMVAKKGVQKIIGTKALDVNKVCGGSNEKVEYIFAAGNFEISKSTSK